MNTELRELILKLIEKNSRLAIHDLAVMLDVAETEVANEIADMEKEHIICGYHTLINWDNTSKDQLTAMIEVKVTPQRGQGFDRIAERIYNFPEVKAVYLMSGGYDFMVMLEGKTMKEISMFTSSKLAPLESKITEKTKMIVVVNPSNPTGGIFSRKTLEKLSEIAIRNDLLVVSDEIYSQLVYDGAEHVSIASIPGMKERTITLGGFSKAYSMTGWRLGYMCAPEGIISACVRVHQYTITCASSFVQDAAIVALNECADDVEAMRQEYQRRKDFMVKALNDIDGISCNNPQGAFYIFVNVKSLGMTSMEVAEYLLEHAKVALVPGSAFGSEGEGYLRISYACSYEDLQEAAKRIREAVAELKAR